MASFGSATFHDLANGYRRTLGLVPALTLRVRFASLADADALAALMTPPTGYSLRYTLNGTPILQVWSGHGVDTLTIPVFLAAQDALLTAVELSDWVPGAQPFGQATFLLTTNAIIP